MAACDVEHIELKHEPLTPCRPDIFGEGIYVEQWRLFLEKMPSNGDGYKNEMFESIFWLAGVNQRVASVAASFFCWLGTNCGQSFLAAAKRDYNEARWPETAHVYLKRWAVENMRHGATNNAGRTIGAMLGKYVRTGHALSSYHDESEITYRDTEVCEIVAEFLGSSAGQKLIRDAEAEIVETRKQIDERRAMQQRAKCRALGLVPDKEIAK